MESEKLERLNNSDIANVEVMHDMLIEVYGLNIEHEVLKRGRKTSRKIENLQKKDNKVIAAIATIQEFLKEQDERTDVPVKLELEITQSGLSISANDGFPFAAHHATSVYGEENLIENFLERFYKTFEEDE
ncbi:MAG: hypothetical protein AB8G11_16700 [Saprospiraceae bacterium]